MWTLSISESILLSAGETEISAIEVKLLSFTETLGDCNTKQGCFQTVGFTHCGRRPPSFETEEERPSLSLPPCYRTNTAVILLDQTPNPLYHLTAPASLLMRDSQVLKDEGCGAIYSFWFYLFILSAANPLYEQVECCNGISLKG